MADVLLYILGILIIVLGLALSIGLHEIGHLLPAKLFGVKVTQYMVGFGRTVWSRRKGETEYGVKALPLGGYVAMTGMYPPNKSGQVRRASTTGFLNTVVQEGSSDKRTVISDRSPELPGSSRARPDDMQSSRRGMAGMVDEARLASAETIEQGEDHRTFYRLPVWKKIVVMLGGPFMNLILAFVFFGIVLMGFGVPQSTTTLGQVSQCLVPASSEATECGADDPEAPAAAAGLLPGDRVLQVDGERVDEWDDLRSAVSAAPGRHIEVRVERAGETLTLSLTPTPNERYVLDAGGEIATDAAGEPVTESVGMIGATPTSELVRQPITEVPAFVGENIAQIAGIIVRLPERMVDVWNAAFGAEERDPDGPISVVGVGRLAGEIVSLDEAPVAARAQTMLGLVGSLNVALLVFNLIPLMPLDGGHVAGALYEGAKRRIARLLGRRDPGPVDTAKMVPVTFAVVVALGAMMVLLVYADIVKPVAWFG